jgi:hypothetical protein
MEGDRMTCTNASCAIFIICQNKDKPCPGNASFTRIVRNGYRTMQMQEHAMRASSIDNRGDWSV